MLKSAQKAVNRGFRKHRHLAPLLMNANQIELESL